MPSIDRVLQSYERGVKKLAEDLADENKSSPQDRAHLMLLARMLQAVVNSYTAHQLDQATIQAAGDFASRDRVLNVSLRRLVDDKLMTPWYARFLNSNLQLKRTIIVSGGPQSGKSTLLNALIDLLPTDHRIVSIDDDNDDGLPVLEMRSFTVQLMAKRGSAARNTNFRKAIDMKPTWVVVGDLGRRDGPGFLETLDPGVRGGLTTVETPDPEEILNEWLAQSKGVAEQLKVLNPLVVHLVREEDGLPRVERVVEVTTDRGNLVVTPRAQVDSEDVGVEGGERSLLAKEEQETGVSLS